MDPWCGSRSPARKAEALRSEISTSLLTSSPEAAPPCREGKPAQCYSHQSLPVVLRFQPSIASCSRANDQGVEGQHLKIQSCVTVSPLPARPARTFTLEVTVKSFKKGNRAVRASTGPLGFFIGTTSLTFEADLRDSTAGLSPISSSRRVCGAIGQSRARRRCGEGNRKASTEIA